MTRLLRWFLLVKLMAVLAILSPTASVAGGQFYPDSAAGLIVGICTHFAPVIDEVSAAGATGVRQGISWAAVERVRGHFHIQPAWDAYIDKAVSEHLTPLMVLAYGNGLYGYGQKPVTTASIDGFSRYAGYVAKHFNGRVRYYEVWNEWERKTGHTKPGSHTDGAGFEGLRFKRADGNDAWALWSSRSKDNFTATLRVDNAPVVVWLRQAGQAELVQGERLKVGENKPTFYRLSLEITGMPRLIIGDLSGVQLEAVDMEPL